MARRILILTQSQQEVLEQALRIAHEDGSLDVFDPTYKHKEAIERQCRGELDQTERALLAEEALRVLKRPA